MSVAMQGRYLGNKKLELTHLQSGTKLITVAPLDNQGDGSSFSPTDLFSVSFPTCVLTIMSIIAENKQINIANSHFSVVKEMNENPRRIKRLDITFHLPAALTEDERRKLLLAIESCPVHRSIHPDVELDIKVEYDV